MKIQMKQFSGYMRETEFNRFFENKNIEIVQINTTITTNNDIHIIVVYSEIDDR